MTATRARNQRAALASALFGATLAASCTRTGAPPGAHATVPPAPSTGAKATPADGDRTPPNVRTQPHPAVATITAALGHDEGDEEATCRAVTGFSAENFDRCTLVLLANGTAINVDVSHDCGEHSCSVASFVWYGDDPAPYSLSDGMPLEVTPDHRYLLVSSLTYEDDIPFAPTGGRTDRIDRASGTREPFLDCFSAVLSPKSRYYVCRDIHANVLRVGVEGGRPELFAPAKLPPDERVKLGGPFGDYPAPVRFLSERELEYEVFEDNSGEVVEHRAAWDE